MTFKFDPPGYLTDLDSAQAEKWHEFISGRLDRAIKGNIHRPNDARRPQFFNQSTTPVSEDSRELDIEWTAFPRNVTINSTSDRERWRKADSSRDLQDEYCEWSVERDPITEKIVRISFTCEAPEYWGFLAAVSPAQVIDLYRMHIDNRVQQRDLFTTNGEYRKRNRWNNSTTGGAMHLIQEANSLWAEIELAAGSSIVRTLDGRILTGEQELIECGDYGDATRHSDPHIGAIVNGVARQKADVTIANPVGIYFAGINTSGWESPDGSDLSGLWTYTRGTNEKPLRADLSVPIGRAFVIGDVKINRRPIEFGGQVADHIRMKLVGLATRFGKSCAEAVAGCTERGKAEGGTESVSRDSSVEETLGAFAEKRTRR